MDLDSEARRSWKDDRTRKIIINLYSPSSIHISFGMYFVLFTIGILSPTPPPKLFLQLCPPGWKKKLGYNFPVHFKYTAEECFSECSLYRMVKSKEVTHPCRDAHLLQPYHPELSLCHLVDTDPVAKEKKWKLT